MRHTMMLLALAALMTACGEGRKKTTPQASKKVEYQGDLRDMGEVPAFSFLERGGKPVTKDELKGKVWVAAFIFTNCRTHCVLLCSEMTNLQAEFEKEDDFRILATTVDPARDKPERLKSFAVAQEADPEKWLFAWHSDISAIKAFAHDGLKLPWDEHALNHTLHMVLVDKKSHIRGYYMANDVDRMKKLRTDIRTLLKQ